MASIDDVGGEHLASVLANNIVTIDGSYGEGGGQILRNACAYAAILRKSVKIEKIRAGRPKPGLQRQHLVGLQLLERCCEGYAKLVGGRVGAQEIHFLVDSQSQTCDKGDSKRTTRKRCDYGDLPHDNGTSGVATRRVYTGDTHTAGSICLLLQAVLPLGLFSPRRGGEPEELCFVLKGGTNASMAPQYDYFEHVFFPTLKRCCRLDDKMVDARVLRRGFYPRGGGEIHVVIRSRLQQPLPPIRLTEFGKLTEIEVRAFSGGTCPRSVAQNLQEAAKAYLSSSLSNNDVSWKESSLHYENALGSGSGILLVAKTSSGCVLGGSAVGSPKIPYSETARQAVTEVIEALENTSGDACVDEYLQDQLILYMALAEGVSEITTNCLTQHTRTAIWLAEQLCAATFEVTRFDEGVAKADDQMVGKIPGRHLIRCRGIGLWP